MQAEEKKQSVEKVYGRFWKELYVVAYRSLLSEQDELQSVPHFKYYL